MNPRVLFLDNEFIPANDQLVKRLTPGVLKARGVFETMRVYPMGKEGRKGKIFGLQEHFSRLKRGLKILQLESPLSQKQMQEALERVLFFFAQRMERNVASKQYSAPRRIIAAKSGFAINSNHFINARVRFIIWQDDRREKVHAAVMASAYDPFPAAQYRKGFKVIISKTKLAAVSLLKEVKSLDCVPFLQAYRRAKARGYDEALLLNHRGEVVEGSCSNIFF